MRYLTSERSGAPTSCVGVLFDSLLDCTFYLRELPRHSVSAEFPCNGMLELVNPKINHQCFLGVYIAFCIDALSILFLFDTYVCDQLYLLQKYFDTEGTSLIINY